MQMQGKGKDISTRTLYSTRKGVDTCDYPSQNIRLMAIEAQFSGFCLKRWDSPVGTSARAAGSVWLILGVHGLSCVRSTTSLSSREVETEELGRPGRDADPWP